MVELALQLSHILKHTICIKHVWLEEKYMYAWIKARCGITIFVTGAVLNA